MSRTTSVDVDIDTLAVKTASPSSTIGSPASGVLKAGDVVGARFHPDGLVEVFRNGTVILTRTTDAWPGRTGGGLIGFTAECATNAGGTVVDNFGGGNVK